MSKETSIRPPRRRHMRGRRRTDGAGLKLEVGAAQGGDPAKRPSKPSTFCSGVTFPPHAGSVLPSVDFCSSLLDKSQVVPLAASVWLAAADRGHDVSWMSPPLEMERGCDAGPNGASDAVEDAGGWRRWRAAQRATAVPSRPLRTANEVVAPCAGGCDSSSQICRACVAGSVASGRELETGHSRQCRRPRPAFAGRRGGRRSPRPA